MKGARFINRCQQCGYTSPQWMGRCPECGEWNTFIEEPLETPISSVSQRNVSIQISPPQPISKISTSQKIRFSSGLSELDRVLGGGIVPGSLVLIGGEPGVGKSTLLLQSSGKISRLTGPVLLVTGEESATQVKIRAERINSLVDKLFVFSETDIVSIGKEIENIKPTVVIIDSIQTMFHPDVPSTPGSVTQVRECTQLLARIGKTRGIPIFIVGHVTKDGAIAGPRTLEHMVDTVLYFEGDRTQSYRILRAVKNRYGSTDEIGVFEMSDEGLKEVTNPSAVFLSHRAKNTPGSVVVGAIEGTRSLLVELQALVAPTNLAYPRRVASGIDGNRLSLMIAVLERRASLRLGNRDIFISVVGGLQVGEPAADLAIALAIASGFKDKPLKDDLVVFGEVGLAGEIRPVAQVEKRLKEARKLGFRKAILPQGLKDSFSVPDGLQAIKIKTLKEAFSVVF